MTQKIATPIIEAVGRNDKKRVISVRIRTPQQMRKTEDCHRSGFLAQKREPPFVGVIPLKSLILLDFLLAEVALQQAFESLAVAGFVAGH